ncbi:hypothetical protein GGI43DRAFT_359277 [Trichoderma evansii]
MEREFVQHKRRRLPSLIRLNRRHFKLYRYSYNQEKSLSHMGPRHPQCNQSFTTPRVAFGGYQGEL